MKKGVRKIKKIQKENLAREEKSIRHTLLYRLAVIFFITLVLLLLFEVILMLFFDGGKNLDLTNLRFGELGSQGVFNIENPSPNGSVVSFFVGESKTFSISNENYDRSEWFLDGKSILSNSRSLELKNLKKGNYTLEVRITNASQIEFKVWKVIVEDDDMERRFVFNIGKIIFGLIIAIGFILIIMIIWMIILELMKKEEARLGICAKK